MSKFLQLLTQQTAIKRRLFIGVLNLIVICAESGLLVQAFHLVSSLRPLRESVLTASFEQEVLVFTATMIGIVTLSVSVAMKVERQLARLRRHLQVGWPTPRLPGRVIMWPHFLAIVLSELWFIYDFPSWLMLVFSLLSIVTLTSLIIFLQRLLISP